MTSPIRCRGPWKIQKRTSEPDRWLEEMGFFRKHTARDSSCLFRAVSENVYNTQHYYNNVRLECVHFMATKRHLFEGSLSSPFENYLKEISNPSEWGGLVEISAMSHLYRRDFVIFGANKGPQTKICNGYGNTIYLFYFPDSKHFDVVYTKDFINTSALCQSLVYEILYEGVYELKDLSYAVDKMLHDKAPNHIQYFMSENVERRKKQKERAKIFIETNEDKDTNNNAVALKCKHHTQDLERASLLKESLSIFVFNRSLIQLENVCMNCLNVNSAKDLLDNGITPFPYKVAKALDPDIYRNIEFDAWSEMRRELRYGARYSDGTTLQVGVKCLCRLQKDQLVPFHCHIQEMRPEGGPCLVFIEELGEKRVVNYDQLEPLPVEVKLPVMVDVRSVGGAAGHDVTHQAPTNGASAQDNHHAGNNQSGGGDMVPTSPAARASTPATTAIPAYPGMNNMSNMNMGMGGYYYSALPPAPPNKLPLLWVPPGHPPPPSHHVNMHVYKSMQPNGADLPMNDIPTLRYYFNLGVECMWAAYGPPPPRHYPPRDLAQDMQQLSLQDRGNNHDMHKHKPAGDKTQHNQNKNNQQRTLLGPRFNKRGNQEGGNQNINHNQNKGHNNNTLNNKGPNNRRNMHEGRGAYGAALGPGAAYNEEGELVPVPYVPYVPPLYPLHYCPVDCDPPMLGMMPGMTYMNYEEAPEYMPYYPPVYGPPPPAPTGPQGPPTGPPGPPAGPPPGPHHVPMHIQPHMHHQEHK